MKYRYLPVREVIKNSPLGYPYIAYGLQAVLPDGQIAATASDVCCRLEHARELARMCTEHNLEPVHLNDVVQDYLYKLYTVEIEEPDL